MLNVTALDNVTKDANNQTAYQRFRYSLISTFEAIIPTVYLDDKGTPSIGIGFNLRDDNILKLVLASFGVSDTAFGTFDRIVENIYAGKAALQAALDAEMLKQQRPKVPESISF